MSDVAPDTKRTPLWWAKLVVIVLLAVNLLDLTTSVPSVYNNFVGVRSTAALVVQCLLVLPLLPLVPTAVRWLDKQWRALPVPRIPKIVLTLFIVVELGHIAFQQESFPFTDVGMFTFKRPTWRGRLGLRYIYAYPQEDGSWEIFSLRRTGDVLWPREVKIDRMLALLYIKYRNHQVVYDAIAEHCREAGVEPPVPVHGTLILEKGNPRFVNVKRAKLVPLGQNRGPAE